MKSRKVAVFPLRRLLLGADSLRFDSESRPGEELLEAFNEAVGESLRDPIASEMELIGQINNPADRSFAWEVTKSGKVKQQTEDATMRCSVEVLRNWYQLQERDAEIDLVWYTSTSYTAVSRFGGRRQLYVHHTVSRGCAVSVVTRRNEGHRPVVQGVGGDEDGELQFYAVHGVLRASTGEVWCAVRKLSALRGRCSVRGNAAAVLKMGRRVRRVGMFHACDEGCSVHAGRMRVRHSKSVLEGAEVVLRDRSGGYPPFKG